ncbi:MAG: hypothetical protein ABIH17_09440, partial [Pseudomonadota bacterium]
MTKLAVLPGLGLPEWTEIGQATGLDPLGMARPTEAVYQSLLPGISTITNRLRYYSFFPWILDVYARTSGDTSAAAFVRFQRRSEALFALAGVVGQYDLGLTGANWATNLLSQAGNILDFGATAERTDGKGYLKNKSGALGAIYGPHLREMSLIGSSPAHSLAVPTERGDRMAEAMARTLRTSGALFTDAVATGTISRSDLESLAIMKPSAIEPESPEQVMLAATLLGDEESATEMDRERRSTMLRILRHASETGEVPSAYDLRWTWYSASADANGPHGS